MPAISEVRVRVVRIVKCIIHWLCDSWQTNNQQEIHREELIIELLTLTRHATCDMIVIHSSLNDWLYVFVAKFYDNDFASFPCQIYSRLVAYIYFTLCYVVIGQQSEAFIAISNVRKERIKSVRIDWLLKLLGSICVVLLLTSVS